MSATTSETKTRVQSAHPPSFPPASSSSSLSSDSGFDPKDPAIEAATAPVPAPFLEKQKSDSALPTVRTSPFPVKPIQSPYFSSAKSASSTKEPLSLKFIHKPSRSKELFEKANDQTKINSQLNGKYFNELFSTETDEITSGPDEMETETTLEDQSGDFEEEHRLIRKKSGEVLKPSLKDSASSSYFLKKRTQSLPTTPTYKQVHFGAGNDVVYFKKKDRPAAISASNSPKLEGQDHIRVGNYDDDDDDDYDSFGDDESDLDLDVDAHLPSELTMNLNKKGSTMFVRKDSGTQVDWDLKLPNFPVLSYDRKLFQEWSKVFLERMFISIDKKFLLGHIAVKNLAFEKSIIVRYTFDHWATIIEIPTVYVPDIPQILKKNEYDRFIFKIPLISLFNSSRISTSDGMDKSSNTKSFQLCIKYTADKDEYWDNNNFNNYDFNLTKISNKKESAAKAPVPAGPVPPQQLPKLQSHTNKPKYSSSYLKRRLSDSTLEVNNHNHNPASTLHDKEAANTDSTGSIGNSLQQAAINSPDTYFDTTSPSTSSRIVGTNNSPFNYNFAYANGSALSMDKDLISPILSVQKNSRPFKLEEDFKLTRAPPAPSSSSPDADDGSRRLSPTKEFDRISNSKNHQYPASAATSSSSSTARPGTTPNSSTLDAKSYKELLDTYCFFSKPDENENNGNYNNSLTTVSSILGFRE